MCKLNDIIISYINGLVSINHDKSSIKSDNIRVQRPVYIVIWSTIYQLMSHL